MTIRKSFKRLVRARMAKTGESYTAARAQLLNHLDDSSRDQEIPKLVCSDERIRARSGRSWEEWFDLLDSWDAESLNHTEIARRVAVELGIPPLAWNVQAIVTSFERSRGKREVGQRSGSDGYVATASRTIAASAESAFSAVTDPALRARWLGDMELTQRTVSPQRSARFDVDDGSTRLLVSFTDKGSNKSTVTVEHSRLQDAVEREKRKAFWREALTALKQDLEREH